MKENISVKTIAIVFITGIITSIATNIVNWFFQIRNYNLEQEKNAAILYYDIQDGITGIKINLEVGGVLENSYSEIHKDYLKYASYLRPKLEEKHSRTIRKYYKNIKLLEQSRLNYWSNKDNKLEKMLKDKYIETLKMVNLSLEQINIQETLDILSKKAKIKN